ncbi:Receptor-type tyrosine-protein phosphatase N2 [Schistosoma japonicum]|uniref:Receptor-type tyrosine-protein phosphatase N2 n=1 Tax=Schistosoma japonicum TaxID=6182 RepID=A0A4Z2CMJ2_SCHJA|nr:Receptor-type tyrosine-protein phosphatase N2 [Schistosoma japonicum]
MIYSDPMQQPQFREISPLEFQTNQQEEMIIPSDSVTRLRAHKVISGSSKQLERRWIWIKFLNGPITNQVAQSILFKISHDLKLASPISFFFLDKSRRVLYFHVPSSAGVSADTIVDALNTKINAIDGYPIEDVGFGRGAVNTVNTRSTTDTTTKSPQPSFLHRSVDDEPFKTTGRIKWERYTMTLVLCSTILAAVLILTTIYLVQICRKKHKFKSESNEKLSCHSDDSSQLESKTYTRNNNLSASQQSSISSNSTEPVHCSIDVPTGHLILSYMEKHLRDRSRLEADWNAVDKYVSEDSVVYEEGRSPKNQSKNRENAPIPYEQSRVKLRSGDNDYINASLLYDNNPRNPVYIATITPTIKSIPDFWLMIWEQGCVVIVCLERTDELKRMDEIDQFELNDESVKYWPNEGSQVYGSFEVHLVSEHSWNAHYIVRSLYLKSIITNETRTVTQFHYLTWKDENLKENSKPMLEFRRKVNRSFRGLMSPIVVHCSDGCGRTGAYILLDLALNRITKSIKEIDIAASLEHLRDQRPNMIKTLEQYEFVLSSTAEEVDAMLQTSS